MESRSQAPPGNARLEASLRGSQGNDRNCDGLRMRSRASRTWTWVPKQSLGTRAESPLFRVPVFCKGLLEFPSTIGSLDWINPQAHGPAMERMLAVRWSK